MKTLKEALISKDKRDWVSVDNKYSITEKDMIGDLEGFPVGIVIKMMEEQEKQGNKPNVKIFQQYRMRDVKFGGFHWDDTEEGQNFWEDVITHCKFDIFFKKYPKYKKYN